jgi:ribosome recycling factor
MHTLPTRRGQTDLQKRLYELTAKAEADLGRVLETSLDRFLHSLIQQIDDILAAKSKEVTLGQLMRNVINGNR